MKCKHCQGEVKETKKLPYKSRKSNKVYRFYRCERCGLAFSMPRQNPDQNSPRLIHKSKIKWKCAWPEGFTCFLCRRGKGEWSVHIGVGILLVKSIVCTSCANLSLSIIAEGFVGEVGGRNVTARYVYESSSMKKIQKKA